MDEELYEEVMPDDESDEEEESEQDKDKEETFEENDAEVTEESGLKTPGEGYIVYFVFLFQATVVFQNKISI
jgi:hypothetical protein